MGYYYFQCRSVTYAQRASKILKNHGIHASVVKLPVSISNEGCGYSLRISERNGLKSLTLLRDADFKIGKIYFSNAENQFVEVLL